MSEVSDAGMLGGVLDPHGRAVEMKATFADVYDRPDPRRYFRVLGDLGYAEVGHMHRITEALLARLAPWGSRANVLDVCCSYGTLGMLLGTDLSFEDLLARYRDPLVASWSSAHLAERDRELLLRHRRPDGPRVHGVDVAEPAVAYARTTGAVETGLAEDLEAAAPSRRLRDLLAAVDLVTVAGGIGYVTERTLERILRHTPSPPWIAALVSRVYPYDRIAERLDAWGLSTERLTTRTFPRRRFADAAERRAALAQLERLGIDPTGREAEGWYHAELHLSRPAGATSSPIDTLLSS